MYNITPLRWKIRRWSTVPQLHAFLVMLHFLNYLQHYKILLWNRSLKVIACNTRVKKLWLRVAVDQFYHFLLWHRKMQWVDYSTELPTLHAALGGTFKWTPCNFREFYDLTSGGGCGSKFYCSLWLPTQIWKGKNKLHIICSRTWAFTTCL